MQRKKIPCMISIETPFSSCDDIYNELLVKDIVVASINHGICFMQFFRNTES